MKFLKPKHKKQAAKVLQDWKHLSAKLLLECWNAERPHFGGGGPHRYDDGESTCSYCGRPKDWKPVNAGFAADEIIETLETKGA